MEIGVMGGEHRTFRRRWFIEIWLLHREYPGGIDEMYNKYGEAPMME
jgi:hypothetical protein